MVVRRKLERTKCMSKTDWLTTERLVQLIEKSISPNSIVEHNVKLPDLTSTSNAKRQCDIVIKSGNHPRETITIVEVQSRTSKFNITFFQGLIQKMRDVGAQHLICVSTEGFTKTIKEKAKDLGGTVRLVKLTKHDTQNLPIDFIKMNFIDSRPIYDFKDNPKINFKPLKGDSPGEIEFQINLGEVKFILPSIKDIEFEIKGLVQHYFNTHEPSIDGIYKVKLPEAGSALFMKINNQILEVDTFEWDISVKIKKQEVPAIIYSYEQEEIGPIAWALEGTSTMDGITNMIRVSVNPGSENNFIITGIEVSRHEANA